MDEERSETEVKTGVTGRVIVSKLLRSLLYVAYLSVFVLVGVYFVFFRSFVEELSGRLVPETPGLQEVRHVPPEVLSHVGNIQHWHDSSFVNFEIAKPEGVQRLCAYGDSFTYGDEVGPAYDYPTLLDGLYKAAGQENVQVLNFGNGWHGFHQAHIIWDQLGRNFDCDVVLLGPTTFFPKRDTEINHSDLRSPYFLHSRYVLDGDGVRLIPVRGETHAERFQHYFRFIPHWNYLRYDRRPPALLASMLSRDQEVGNPFYYFSGTQKEEAWETYRVLLRQMVEDSPRVVVGLYSEEMVEFLRDAVGSSLDVHKFERPMTFPYRAPKNHNSPTGNQLLAEQFFGALEGTALGQEYIQLSSDLPPVEAMTTGESVPLQNFEQLELYMGEVVTGHLVAARRGERHGEGGGDVLSDSGAASLLFLGDSSTPFPEGGLLPLEVELDGGELIEVRVDDEVVAELGTVELVSAGLNVGVLRHDSIVFRDQEKLLLKEAGSVNFSQWNQGGKTVEVFLDDRAIFRATRADNLFQLEPVSGELMRFRAVTNTAIRKGEVDDAGTVDLVLSSQEGQQVRRYPVASWSWGSASITPPPVEVAAAPEIPLPENPFLEEGRFGVGVGWESWPLTNIGQFVEITEGSLHIRTGAGAANVLSACTSDLLPMNGPFVAISEWRYRGVEAELPWQGARQVVFYFDAARERLAGQEWTVIPAQGQGNLEDWTRVAMQIEPPTDAHFARMCLSLHSATAGEVWMRNAGLVSLSSQESVAELLEE